MTHNLKLILGIALVFGISTGLYEFLLPLLLRARGISFDQIGLIFAASGVAVVAVRIYMGGLSDLWGRKPLYGLAIVITGLGTVIAASPSCASLLAQALLKTVRDTAALTRNTLHSVVIYEEGGEGFLDRIGKFVGLETLLTAFGTGIAGLIIYHMTVGAEGFMAGIYLSGGLLVFASLWWFAGFREHKGERHVPIIGVRELLNFDLHPNLMIILVANAIFTIGMQISHGFFMQIFFKEYFHLNVIQYTVIMIIHRCTLAIPMIVIGNLPIKNLKAWYIYGYLVQGAVIAASVFVPIWWLSASVWLLHDFIGSGIWTPIQTTLIQDYSRDATRGLEVGKVLAWSSLGGILGFLACGVLADMDLRLPFFVSGIIIILAAVPLIWLNMKLRGPNEVAEAA